MFHHTKINPSTKIQLDAIFPTILSHFNAIFPAKWQFLTIILPESKLVIALLYKYKMTPHLSVLLTKITEMFLQKTSENTEMFSVILNCSFHFCEIAMHKAIGFF